MTDPYLYDDCNVLKNLLNIFNEDELDVAEAELSRANMMLLYETGFADFSSSGIRFIHKKLFGNVYDWAGQYRIINIQKREPLLGGNSVWYSNCTDIDKDLNKAWQNIRKIRWEHLSQKDFAKNMARLFPALWQVHPFREGNTRTIVMLLTFFVEYYGYYFDKELMAASAEYVRNAFVLASLGEHSEFEHLENILYDAILDDPAKEITTNLRLGKSKKYESNHTYKPTKHEYIQ